MAFIRSHTDSDSITCGTTPNEKSSSCGVLANHWKTSGHQQSSNASWMYTMNIYEGEDAISVSTARPPQHEKKKRTKQSLEICTQSVMNAIEPCLVNFQKDLLWRVSCDYNLSYEALICRYSRDTEPTFLLRFGPSSEARAREPSPFVLDEQEEHGNKSTVYTDHTIPMRERLRTIVGSFPLG